MGIVWLLVGAGAAGMALGVWLFIRALRHRRGRVFGILGGLALILAVIVLLACYVPVFVLPDAIAASADFNAPAPVAASATVFYISPADMYSVAPSVLMDTLIAVVARSGAIRWQRTLPGWRSQLAVVGDVAYVATLQGSPTDAIMVTAYRGSDGALLWQSTGADNLPQAALAVAGNTVYVLGGVGEPNPQATITALRAADGTRRWSVEIGTYGYAATPLLATPGAVYLATSADLSVYRASDGTLLWTHAQLAAAPVVGDGVAYLPLSNGGFAAVRADDGSVICRVGGNFDVAAGALDGNTLYLSGLILGPENPPYPSALYAYDAATCVPRWHVANVGGELVAGSGTLYVENYPELLVLRGTDGKVLWHRSPQNSSLRGTAWAFAAQPALLGSTLYATSALLTGGIHILGSDGWIHLYAFNGTDGFEYWQVPVGPHVNFQQPLG